MVESRRALVAAFVVLGAISFARADEAGAKKALDEAEDQLANKQWDLCQDALGLATEQMKPLSGAARTALVKRHAAIREKCDAGERGYKHRKLVLKLRNALVTVKKELAAKNYETVALLLDEASSDTAPLDPPTQTRFTKEITQLRRSVEDERLRVSFENVEKLLEQQAAVIAASPTRANPSVRGALLIIDGLVAALPADHPRTQAARKRLSEERDQQETILRKERELVVPPVLNAWRTAMDKAPKGAPSTLTIATWSADPVLAHHCAGPIAALDAANAWRANEDVREALEKFRDDLDLRATAAEVDRRETTARAEIAGAIAGFLDACESAASGEKPKAAAGVRSLVAELARIPNAGAAISQARERATALAARLSDDAPAQDGSAESKSAGTVSPTESASGFEVPTWLPAVFLAAAAVTCAVVIVRARSRPMESVPIAFSRARTAPVPETPVADPRPAGHEATAAPAVPAGSRAPTFGPPPTDSPRFGPSFGPPASTTPQIGRDLIHEAHIRAIAFWNFVGAALLILGAMAIVKYVPEPAVRALVPSFIAFGVVSGLLGIGLWIYHPTARLANVIYIVVMIVWSFVSEHRGPPLAAIANLVWNLALLRALLSGSAPMIFTHEYRAQVRGDGILGVPFWSSPFFYVPIVFVMLSCFISVAVMTAMGR